MMITYRKPGPLALDATGETVRFSIGDDSLIRATDRSGVARATDAVIGSPSGEVFHAGEWLNESDLDELGAAMTRKRLANKAHPHLFEADDDTIRCRECHELPGRAS